MTLVVWIVKYKNEVTKKEREEEEKSKYPGKTHLTHDVGNGHVYEYWLGSWAKLFFPFSGVTRFGLSFFPIYKFNNSFFFLISLHLVYICNIDYLVMPLPGTMINVKF